MPRIVDICFASPNPRCVILPRAEIFGLFWHMFGEALILEPNRFLGKLDTTWFLPGQSTQYCSADYTFFSGRFWFETISTLICACLLSANPIVFSLRALSRPHVRHTHSWSKDLVVVVVRTLSFLMQSGRTAIGSILWHFNLRRALISGPTTLIIWFFDIGEQWKSSARTNMCMGNRAASWQKWRLRSHHFLLRSRIRMRLLLFGD